MKLRTFSGRGGKLQVRLFMLSARTVVFSPLLVLHRRLASWRWRSQTAAPVPGAGHAIVAPAAREDHQLVGLPNLIPGINIQMRFCLKNSGANLKPWH